MTFDYDQDTEDLINEFMAFVLSDFVVTDLRSWTVCHIRADMTNHLRMLDWCKNTLGRKHRGIKTGVFKLFAIPGRWYYDQHTFDIMTREGVRRRYWFKHASDFEMFKLVWFDEINGR